MTNELFDLFSRVITDGDRDGFDFLTSDMSRFSESDKYDILMAATANSPSLDFYKHVTDKGFDLTAKDEHNMTMLHYAGYSDVPEIADYIIRSGVDVNAAAEEHCSPILYAAAHTSNAKVIDVLLAGGADMGFKDSTGTGVLHAAAGYNPKPEITDYFIKKGLDLEEKDINGLTPAMFCALNNSSPDVLFLLKKAGADFYAQTPQGGNLFHLAAENPSVAIAECLSMFFSVYDADRNGFTPIELAACRNRNPEVMEIMLRCQKTENFFMAIMNDNPAMVRYMISRGCDPNMLNTKFNRPIFCVAQNSSNPEIMETLISAGAILSVNDMAGRNAAHYAAVNKDAAIYDYLKEHYAEQINFAAEDNDMNTPEDYKKYPQRFK